MADTLGTVGVQVGLEGGEAAVAALTKVERAVEDVAKAQQQATRMAEKAAEVEARSRALSAQAATQAVKAQELATKAKAGGSQAAMLLAKAEEAEARASALATKATNAQAQADRLATAAADANTRAVQMQAKAQQMAAAAQAATTGALGAGGKATAAATKAQRFHNMQMAESVNMATEFAWATTSAIPGLQGFGMALAMGGNSARTLGMTLGPIGIAIGLIVGVLPVAIQWLMKFAGESEDAAKAQKTLAERVDEATKAIQRQREERERVARLRRGEREQEDIDRARAKVQVELADRNSQVAEATRAVAAAEEQLANARRRRLSTRDAELAVQQARSALEARQARVRELEAQERQLAHALPSSGYTGLAEERLGSDVVGASGAGNTDRASGGGAGGGSRAAREVDEVRDAITGLTAAETALVLRLNADDERVRKLAEAERERAQEIAHRAAVEAKTLEVAEARIVAAQTLGTAEGEAYARTAQALEDELALLQARTDSQKRMVEAAIAERMAREAQKAAEEQSRLAKAAEDAAARFAHAWRGGVDQTIQALAELNEANEAAGRVQVSTGEAMAAGAMAAGAEIQHSFGNVAARGLEQLVGALIEGEKVSGKAVARMVADALKGIAIEATVKAVFQLAEALAAAASFNAPKAAAHAASAATFAAAAALTGGAAAALGAAAGPAGGSARAPSAADARLPERSRAEDRQRSEPAQYIINVGTFPLSTEADIGRAVGNAIDAAHRRDGARVGA